MSTRSRIGIRNKNDSVESIYCHFDGYYSYVGKILVNYYKDESDVRELLSLGDIRALGRYPTEAHCDAHSNEELDSSLLLACQPYNDGHQAIVSRSVEDYYKDGQEYNYLFVDGEWYDVKRDAYDGQIQLRSVKECLEKNSKQH